MFSSPVLGAFYGLEMPFRNRLDASAYPAVLAAGSSFAAASLTNNARTLMTHTFRTTSGGRKPGVLIVGALCVGRRTRLRVGSWTRRGFKDGLKPWLRAGGAGIVLSLLAMAAWFRHRRSHHRRSGLRRD